MSDELLHGSMSEKMDDKVENTGATTDEVEKGSPKSQFKAVNDANLPEGASRRPNGLVAGAWPEAKMLGPANQTILKLTVFCIIETAIGTGIAYAVYAADRLSYDAQIFKIKTAFGADIGFLYLAMIMYQIMAVGMGGIAAMWRVQIDVGAPHQAVMKVAGKDPDTEMPYVILAEEGDYGAFNRAQRAVLNTGEYLPLVLTWSLLGGLVFPKPIFVLACLYMLTRILYAKMYADETEGRGAGFGISQHLVAPTMLGFTLIAMVQLF